MDQLVLLATLFVSTNAGLIRVPKIYNALISSDENLSPSHAIPVLEPVLRTTALGVAFPPLFIQSPGPELLSHNFDVIANNKDQNPNKVVTSKTNGNPNESKDTNDTNDEGINQRKKEESKPPLPPQLTYHGSLYPLAVDPYFTYTYTPELLYPSLPYYHQPIFVDLGHPGTDNSKPTEPPPPHPPFNFKKNPDIPDVPPPPLPVKDSNAGSTKSPKTTSNT